MTKILVVDDMAVFREPIAAALRASQYDVEVAENGRIALGVLRSGPVDLMLLDIAMPIMDGLELLNAVQRDPQLELPPTILLTAVAERDYVVQAAQLGIREYLLKSQFSLEDLLVRVVKHLNGTSESSKEQRDGGGREAATASASKPDSAHVQSAGMISNSASGDQPADAAATLKEMKPLLRKSEMLERVERRVELKAFSPTVSKLMQLTGGEGASIDQVVRVIKQDHALAVRILQLANSCIYTRGEPIETVDKAVLRIGLAEIRQAAINIGVVDQLSQSVVRDHVSAGHFWEHSIATGLIASMITKDCSDDAADTAFTMGLMHDVGRVMIAEEFPEEYEQVISVARELDLPLERVESRLLMTNHSECMDRLLHHWKFPKDLIDPIVFHHASVEDVRRLVPRRIDSVVTLALADRLSHALMIGSSGNDFLYPTKDLCEVLRLEPKTLERIENEAREVADDLKLAMLSSLGPVDWEDCRELARRQIEHEIRPLFASAHMPFDSTRIFLEQIRVQSDQAPNIAVIHIADKRDLNEVARSLRAQEQGVKTEALPLLALMSAKSEVPLAREFSDRQVTMLELPAAISSVIEVFNRVLNNCELATAA